MQPLIEILDEKKLVGMRLKMSLADDRTGELWRAFMPRRREIANARSDDKFSVQVYREPLRMGDLCQEFEKWAAVEVADFTEIPAGMENFVLSGGLYAVFHYRGMPGDARIFVHIFTEWLPASGFVLDDRPHFEVLGEKYRNGAPDSEEEIWIPIKPKNENGDNS